MIINSIPKFSSHANIYSNITFAKAQRNTVPIIQESLSDTYELPLSKKQINPRRDYYKGSNPITRWFNSRYDKKQSREEQLERENNGYRIQAEGMRIQYENSMPEAKDIRNFATCKYLQTADTYFKLEEAVNFANTQYQRPDMPEYVEAKGGFRVYYDRVERKSPYSELPDFINKPTKVTKLEGSGSNVRETVYDFQRGYSSVGERKLKDGSVIFEWFDLIYPELMDDEVFRFAKDLKRPFCARKLKISPDRKSLEAESLTFFRVGRDGKITGSDTYVAPTITYSTKNKGVFEISAASCLVSSYVNTGTARKYCPRTYSEAPQKTFKNGQLEEQYTDFIVLYDSNSPQNAVLRLYHSSVLDHKTMLPKESFEYQTEIEGIV